jgi:hypothetical protein
MNGYYYNVGKGSEEEAKAPETGPRERYDSLTFGFVSSPGRNQG